MHLDEESTLKRTPVSESFAGQRRFVERSSEAFESFLAAAQDYPTRLPEGATNMLLAKPLDATRGHHNFLSAMYAAMNMIQLLQLSPGALIVEVGSGPGWLTELLLGLGYRVHAVEPSAAMVDIARERLTRFDRKFSRSASQNVSYSVCTLEELEVGPDLAGSADAIFFYEALHHLIDEERGLGHAFDLLRDGGWIGIFGEGRWIPGDYSIEAPLREEMQRFGTLESPFTAEYLSHVLRSVGFSDVAFYDGVNGYFSLDQAARKLGDVATIPARVMNTVTAQKSAASGPVIEDHPELTSAELVASDVRFAGNEFVGLTLRLRNTGQTTWPSSPAKRGWVTIVLKEDRPEGVAAKESRNRLMLPHAVLPRR